MSLPSLSYRIYVLACAVVHPTHTHPSPPTVTQSPTARGPMSFAGHCLPPSSSLPLVRSLHSASEETIRAALHNLQTLYCPLRLPASFPRAKEITSAQADSGYVSEDEEEVTSRGCVPDNEDTLQALRADPVERAFAIRWLTSLISRTDVLPFSSEDSTRIIDDAAFILSSFSDNAENDTDESLVRSFAFPTTRDDPIHVQLTDAPLSGTDHTDVGLQSWGASIILSELLCSSPECFSLNGLSDGSSIIELGAGTGLISLVLSKLLPRLSPSNLSITATDYHPAVLENLRTNIGTNRSPDPSASFPISTMLLDWSAPPAFLAASAKMLFAADVVYAPKHAVWLRDCAAQLLTLDGIFWLMVTVRKIGKFEGIPDTAQAAFQADDCPKRDGRELKIVEKRDLEKRRGIGRGDESGYMLYKIMWV